MSKKKGKNRDACPKCLDNMKVIVGKEKSALRRNGNYVTYQYKCPNCSHNWECMFYED